MATTTIPWGDGSGDNIYLTYSSASGDQTVEVSSDANTSAARTKTVTFTAGNVTQTLTVNQEVALPYTPLNYIETDGTAYIDTTIVSLPPKSSEIKVLMGSDTTCGLIGGYTNNSASSKNNRNYALVLYYSGKHVGFTHCYNYVPSDGIPSVNYSVTNSVPFVVKSIVAWNNQSISVLQENSPSWTTFSKKQRDTVSTTYSLLILSVHNGHVAPSGTRLYYCKIYSDVSYGTLIFDGIPVLYNGEYGLWDRVTNSFFGNSASTGAFTGA